MKKKFLVIGTLLTFVLFSCEKDEKVEKVGGVDVNNPTYSTRTYEEGQQAVENTGVKMVNELKSMNQEQGIQATVNLLDLASTSALKAEVQRSLAFSTLRQLASIQKNTGNVAHLMKSLQEEPQMSVEEAFESIAGVYTYNFSTKEFDQALDPSSSAVIIKFPASKTSLANAVLDGEFKINKPTFQHGPFDFVDGTTINELPASFGYTLSVNGTSLVSYLFSAQYNSHGIPTNVTSTLTVGTFVFAATWGYKETELSVNFSFKHGTTTIFDLGAAAGGTFTKESFENAEETKTITENLGGQTYTYTTTEFYPEKVLYNANAHFQFMDIKFAGKIDFKNFATASRNLDAQDLENDADIAKTVENINKYVQIVAVYASDNTAIAKGEAYAVDVDEYEWKEIDGQWKEVLVTKKDVDFRMVFANENKVDFKTYFENGFDDLISSFNSFIDELNTTYGWEMEPVDNENETPGK